MERLDLANCDKYPGIDGLNLTVEYADIAS
jgi:hypothetical protein